MSKKTQHLQNFRDENIIADIDRIGGKMKNKIHNIGIKIGNCRTSEGYYRLINLIVAYGL